MTSAWFIRIAKALLLYAVTAPALPASAQTELLNVSYDPTRELYEAYNKAFIRHWNGAI